MKERSNHLFIKEMECKDKLQFKVDELSLLLDVKVLLKDYYTATFTESENALRINFDNGQTFEISVNEVK